jgi:hypothetical protein
MSIANLVQNYNKCNYFLTADLSIPNNSASAIIFDTASVSNSRISYNFSTGVFTINAPGIYTFNTSITYAENATGVRYAWFIKNANPSRLGSELSNADTSGLVVTIGTTYTDLFNIGDTFLVQGLQNTGNPLLVNGQTSLPFNYTQINITMSTLT